MKTFATLFSLLFMLAGCHTTYMQLYHTGSMNTIRSGDNYVYENDTLKITYQLWTNGGRMYVRVYNKSDQPLYIDWTRSACIINGRNYFYEQDSLLAESDTYHSYAGSYNYPVLASSHSITTRPKYVSFIPPHTYTEKTFLHLLKSYVAMPSAATSTLQVMNGTRKKLTKIYQYSYDADNSPIVLRNYLTLSYDDNFRNPFYTDNNFYISQIESMDLNNFRKVLRDSTIQYYYQQGGDFYFSRY